MNPDGWDGAWRRQVSDLIAAVESSDLVELAIEHGPFALRIERAAPDSLAVHEISEQAVVTVEPAEAVPLTLRSPQVGTFYLSAEPESEPFLHEGDVVEEGQVIGLIEAMKLISEVEAEVGGTVRRILVEDGQPVEYGQPLFELE